MHGSDYYPQPSRFIRELPADLVDEIRLGGTASSSLVTGQLAQQEGGEFSLGQRVLHSKFGEGVILNLEGSGSNMRLQVNFEQAGNKWLVAAYAGLQLA